MRGSFISSHHVTVFQNDLAMSTLDSEESRAVQPKSTLSMLIQNPLWHRLLREASHQCLSAPAITKIDLALTLTTPLEEV